MCGAEAGSVVWVSGFGGCLWGLVGFLGVVGCVLGLAVLFLCV